MRPLSPLCLLSLLLANLCHAQWNQSWSGDLVRQFDYATGVTKDIYVNSPPAGSTESHILGRNDLMEVGKQGARFQLISKKQHAQQLSTEPLDTQFTGSFPTGAITIMSKDPYFKNGTYRTRVDQPYYVRIDTQGILASDNAPIAQRALFVKRTAAVPAPQNFDSAAQYIRKNGYIDGTFTPHTPPHANQSSIEKVRLYTQPRANKPWDVLTSASIEVWPLASCKFHASLNNNLLELSHNEKFTYHPDFSIQLNGLYPDSTTYAVIYKGQKAPPFEPVVIVATNKNAGSLKTKEPKATDSTIPSGTITLNKHHWISPQQPGTYTLEVRTLVPTFSNTPKSPLPETIGHLTFTVR